jgi:hypothetical protein
MSDDESLGQIAPPCAWLGCKKPVLQDLGRGRRKEYCSDTCRRAADRDYKRAKSHVEIFTDQLRRSQHEVAAYRRKAEAEFLTPEQVASIETNARIAFAQAATWVEAGVSPDRAIVELESLVTALRPMLSGNVGFTARSA